MEHHNIDVFPLPKEEKPIYINEPWLIDNSLQWRQELEYDPNPLDDADNIRVYIPLDICKESVLRRLRDVIHQRGAVTEKNETDYCIDVIDLISQIEIYDQIRFIRHMPKQGKHSQEAIELVTKFIKILEGIEVYDAENFPYSTIEKLSRVDKRLTTQVPHRSVRAAFPHTAPHNKIHISQNKLTCILGRASL